MTDDGQLFEPPPRETRRQRAAREASEQRHNAIIDRYHARMRDTDDPVTLTVLALQLVDELAPILPMGGGLVVGKDQAHRYAQAVIATLTEFGHLTTT